MRIVFCLVSCFSCSFVESGTRGIARHIPFQHFPHPQHRATVHQNGFQVTISLGSSQPCVLVPETQLKVYSTALDWTTLTFHQGQLVQLAPNIASSGLHCRLFISLVLDSFPKSA